MPITDADKKLLKQLKEAHKAKYGVSLGKRRCERGCGKVKLVEFFTGYNKRCIACIAVRQHEYWLKRQEAAKRLREKASQKKKKSSSTKKK